MKTSILILKNIEKKEEERNNYVVSKVIEHLEEVTERMFEEELDRCQIYSVKGLEKYDLSYLLNLREVISWAETYGFEIQDRNPFFFLKAVVKD